MPRTHYNALIFGLVLAGVGLAAPLAAQGYRAENRVTVNPLPGGSFEVIEGGGYGARGMWCAAADYARDVLGARGTARVYVKRARGPSQTVPGRKGAVFTLDPTGLDPVPVTITGSSTRRPGSNLSVDHAYSFCADSRLSNR